jgi:hypothetical protein
VEVWGIWKGPSAPEVPTAISPDTEKEAVPNEAPTAMSPDADKEAVPKELTATMPDPSNFGGVLDPEPNWEGDHPEGPTAVMPDEHAFRPKDPAEDEVQGTQGHWDSSATQDGSNALPAPATPEDLPTFAFPASPESPAVSAAPAAAPVEADTDVLDEQRNSPNNASPSRLEGVRGRLSEAVGRLRSSSLTVPGVSDDRDRSPSPAPSTLERALTRAKQAMEAKKGPSVIFP